MKVWLTLASIIFTLSFTFRAERIFDSDTLWHIKAGEWIISHRTVPKVDMFSWSASGANWIAHEWLFEVMLALVSSPVGIALFSTFLALAGLLLLWKLICIATKDENTAIMFFVFSSLLFSIGWSARPHLLAYVLFLLVLFFLYKKRENNLYLWLLPPLFLLWGNCHASVLLGLGVVGLDAILTILPNLGSERITHFKGNRKTIGVFIACGLASLMNPRGMELWLYSIKMVTDPVNKLIAEWQAPASEFLLLGMFMPIVMGVVFAIIKKNKADLFLLVLSLLTLFGAMNSVRHFPYFVITWVMLLAQLAGKTKASRRVVAILPGILVAISFMGFINNGLPVNDPRIMADRAGWPVKAVDWIEENNADKVFNKYNWGGYLIYRNIPVFMDGRNDLYHLGGAERNAFQDINNFFSFKKPLEDVLNETDANYVLLQTNAPQINYLLKLKEWQKVYSDEKAVILARTGLMVKTPEGVTVNLNIQEKPAYFFSPG